MGVRATSVRHELSIMIGRGSIFLFGILCVIFIRNPATTEAQERELSYSSLRIPAAILALPTVSTTSPVAVEDLNLTIGLKLRDGQTFGSLTEYVQRIYNPNS